MKKTKKKPGGDFTFTGEELDELEKTLDEIDRLRKKAREIVKHARKK